MKSIKFILATLPLFLAGCATYNAPAFDLPAGTKVGYHLDLDEAVGISKEGTVVRVFGEFSEKVEGVNWNLQGYAKKEIERILEKYGYAPVDVTEVLLSEPTGLYQDTKKPILFSQNKSKSLTQMYEKANETYVQKYGVEAVLSIHSRPAIISRGSGSASNSVTWGLYHGYLYKTPPFSKKKHFALYAASDSVFLVNPYQRVINWSGPYTNGGLLYKNKKEISDFEPVDNKNLTSTEWARVEKELKLYITERIEQHVRALRAGANGKGGHVNSL